jgi:hypothetical protein
MFLIGILQLLVVNISWSDFLCASAAMIEDIPMNGQQ